MELAAIVAPSSTQMEGEKISGLQAGFKRRLKTIIGRHALFHTAFLLLAIAELGTFISLFSFLLKSSILALSLALPFLTGFSYFVLRLYFQAKKPEQLVELRDLYVASCQDLLGYQEGIAGHHAALAHALSKLASDLHDFEHICIRPPRLFGVWRTSLEKLSCWLYWHDLLLMRELLLHYAVDEQIELVKLEPTDLETHASLAGTYLLLSRVYYEPSRADGGYEGLWIPPGRYSDELYERFLSSAERAIEEYKILSDYVPNDPWVHEQLAYTYSDLGMAAEEIQSYETILSLSPDDVDTLFKLGCRYFQHGLNAKGLQVYEELRRIRYERAGDLLHFYGSDSER